VLKLSPALAETLALEDWDADVDELWPYPPPTVPCTPVPNRPALTVPLALTFQLLPSLALLLVEAPMLTPDDVLLLALVVTPWELPSVWEAPIVTPVFVPQFELWDWDSVTPVDVPLLQLELEALVTLWLVPVVVVVPCATPVVWAVLQVEPELWATEVLWLDVLAQELVSALLCVTPPPRLITVPLVTATLEVSASPRVSPWDTA